MIYWTGKSTSGLCKWSEEADTFWELFKLLMDKEIINDYDYDVYDQAVLEKFDKTEDDEEFKDADGELDYNKVQAFVDKHSLTDEELWLLIACRRGMPIIRHFIATPKTVIELKSIKMILMKTDAINIRRKIKMQTVKGYINYSSFGNNVSVEPACHSEIYDEVEIYIPDKYKISENIYGEPPFFHHLDQEFC